MSKVKISTADLIINDTKIPYVANSLSYTDGFGEYKMVGSTAGAGLTETVFSQDSEQKMSSVKFQLHSTAENMDIVRTWKAALNGNLVQVVTSDIQRTFANAALTNNPEINIGVDGIIDCEFMSDQAS